jgi:mRNA-degrading endonuclease toxin of MazEF toxin-antitoxin module
MSTPDIKQGDIYWVDIPKDHARGSEQYKRRPYVIVSRTAVNKICQTVVGVPLSTAVDPNKVTRHPFRVVIPPREIVKDAGYSGEIKLSLAKTDQVRVVARPAIRQ